MTPHWNGDATVSDVIDGAGARRVVQTGGGPQDGGPHPGRHLRRRDPRHRRRGRLHADGRSGRDGHGDDARRPRRTSPPAQALTFRARKDQSYEFVKYVGVDTELSAGNPEKSAVAASQQAADQGWSALSSAHVAAWDALWRSDIVLPDRPDLQQWVRAGLYGLLSNIRQGADDSISPVGLTSDNYAGLIFWDAETWMYPALLLTHPEVAKSIVEYRYRTRAGARGPTRSGWATRACSIRGTAPAAVTWRRSATAWTRRTASRRSTSRATSRSRSGSTTWPPATASWLRAHGWPMLSGIAEFWASRVTANADGSYSINNVAGPDEYSNGVNDGVVHQRRRRHRAAGRDPRRRGARPDGAGGLDHDRRPSADALRPEPAGLPAVRRLHRLADQAGRHRAADLPGGVADDQPGRGEHAGLLRPADRPGRPGHDRLGARHRRRRDRPARLRDAHLPDAVHRAVRPRALRPVRRGARVQARRPGPARRLPRPSTSSPGKAASCRSSPTA